MTDAENQMPSKENGWVVHRITERAGHRNSGQTARNPSPDYAPELICEGTIALLTAAVGTTLCSPCCPHWHWPWGVIVSGNATRVSLSKGQSLSEVQGSLGRQVAGGVYLSSRRKTAPMTKACKMGSSLSTVG